MLRRLISAVIAFSLKIFSTLFYHTEASWVEGSDKRAWKNIRILILLNHTSLFEFLFFSSFPFSFLWKGSAKVVIPAADKTTSRPVAGKFFKYLTPKTVAISRKRDDTWNQFLNLIEDDSIIVILPEGRMMRPGGLDANGQPMSVRGGVADILQMISGGNMVIAYSGGLHHVQKPGQRFPNLFKTLRIRYESIPVDAYKARFPAEPRRFKLAVIKDLEERKAKHCGELTVAADQSAAAQTSSSTPS